MLEQYLMPVLMSYIERYVKDIQLDELNLWGGDIVLRNVELNLEVETGKKRIRRDGGS